MVAAARRKGVYAEVGGGDMVDFITREPEGSFDLIVAGDALVYVADLAPVCRAVAQTLAPDGLFAFTVETHAASDVVLGDKLRFAHGAAHVRSALEDVGLVPVTFEEVATRTENGLPVPGLLVIAGRA